MCSRTTLFPMGLCEAFVEFQRFPISRPQQDNIEVFRHTPNGFLMKLWEVSITAEFGGWEWVPCSCAERNYTCSVSGLVQGEGRSEKCRNNNDIQAI